MRVAGIHLGVGQGTNAVVLDLLLASNFTDTSSYNTAISTVTGAPRPFYIKNFKVTTGG